MAPETMVIVELPNGVKFRYEEEVFEENDIYAFLASEGYDEKLMKVIKVYKETIEPIPLVWEAIETFFEELDKVKVKVWVNPQDGYIETGNAPEWAETFYMAPEDVTKANQINSQKIDLDARMGF